MFILPDFYSAREKCASRVVLRTFWPDRAASRGLTDRKCQRGRASAERSDVPPQATMNLPQDSTHTMRGLNARLRGFLEQVNKLQEDNHKLEAQIVNWGIHGTSRSRDWSQQERAVGELRAQVRQSCAC